MGISYKNTDYSGINVFGDDMIDKKLKRLSQLGANKSEIRGAIYRAAKGMRMAAKSNAKGLTKTKYNSSGGRVRKHGTLWKSIGMMASKKYRGLYWLGPRHGRKQKNDGWYAHFLESGTQKRKTIGSLKLSKIGKISGKSGGVNRGSIKGRGFMTRAYHSHERSTYLNIRLELFKLIKKYTK